jgi:uncharacterized protein YecT (DUF1311 family)
MSSVLIFFTMLGIAAVDPLDPDYDALSEDQILSLDCTKVAMDADRFVAICWANQSDIWMRRVEAEYEKALKRVDPEMLPHVRKAQAAWVKYANLKCSQWDDTEGTISMRRKSLCELETYRSRAEELANVDGLSG